MVAGSCTAAVEIQFEILVAGWECLSPPGDIAIAADGNAMH